MGRTAPGSRLLLLDVYGGAATTSDTTILAALNWVAANAGPRRICAVNLSSGDGSKNTAPCGASPYEAGFAAVRAAGVALVAVASGNNYYSNAISAPACAPSATSVGAGEWRLSRRG